MAGADGYGAKDRDRDRDKDVEAAITSHHPHHPGPTLLPAAVARAVTLATRSTSIAIRLSSLVGAYSLDAARLTTLSSLELARGMVEGVLARAARDTSGQAPASRLAAAEAESILERSLDGLHRAVATAVFWTSAGFRFTGASLAAASGASQLLLSSLDQVFGSTDSSRAVAGVIALVRREFNNPATGAAGEKVGVVDLVLALAALAYLQRACWRLSAEEQRRRAYEEIIWDVVVLNDGERVDIQEQDERIVELSNHGPVSGADGSHGQGDMQDDEAVLTRLKSHIVSSLAPGTNVSISSSVSSVQTITVDVEGSDLPSLPTPPGAEIVETRGPSSQGLVPDAANHRPWTPHGHRRRDSYRVVYRIERDKFRSTSLRGEEDDESGRAVVEVTTDEPISPLPSDATRPYEVDHRQNHSPPASLSTLFSTDSPLPDSDHDSVTLVPGVITSPVDPPDSGSRSGTRRSSHSTASETAANQKKQRSPLTPPASSSRANVEKQPRPALDGGKRSLSKKKGESVVAPPHKSADKKTGFKQVLKGSSQSLTNIWNKESPILDATRPSKTKPQWKGSGNADSSSHRPKPIVTGRGQTQHPQRDLAKRSLHTPEPIPGRPSSRASYVSIHDRRRDSIVSQTDAFSIHTNGEMRPASPTIIRTDYSTHESSTRPRSGVFSGDAAAAAAVTAPSSPHKTRGHGLSHRRSASYAPSLYSLATNDSQSSLVLSSYYQKSAYHASDALATLRREGFVDGAFPAGHLLPNMARYMRFSSACYGSRFLKVMGISTQVPVPGVSDDAASTHHDVRHFVHHTESGADSILLASFVDPQGGADASGATGTGVPLVHYISLDHGAKAVVLACRGTLGFEDVLADMTCEYDDMIWRGRRYKVHKGIHASARRLLYGDDGRVLVTIREALHEFPDYGLVLCGHSLGGGVTSLLGVMLAQPNPDGPGFVISAEPHVRLIEPPPGAAAAAARAASARSSDIRLPSGRRIHVYAYGSPGVMAPPLRKLTRGLITSVVHGNDLVPHLSLGVLHDMQALALAFKSDENKTKADIRARMWNALRTRWAAPAGFAQYAGGNGPGETDEEWLAPALDALRQGMRSAKLVPPGEVFAIETQRVLRRDAFVLPDGDGPVGRPARRIVLKYVRDVEARFGEVRFGTGMLTDHNPAKYEEALNMLRLGVV
ncbi:lipase [Purpureocillium lavendulum]|uniref:sn-1-specific diacylglycerol lipase n=1 Tax=Purpureocillium lavendulum TaxID=1247861 RepID=A0AB34FT78_9HYPO|nr:lipase [Purpureocillium lavendulum]